MTALNKNTSKIAVLSGGTSGEREISLSSGEGVIKALSEAGYQVEHIDPANKADCTRLMTEDFDVAFIALHGKQGEDGTIQGMLEILGIPYTGPGVLASALAMDKAMSKVVYRANGLPTADSVQLKRGEPFDIERIVDELGIPCVAKPDSDGSALGVTIVHDKSSLKEAIEKAFELDSSILVEQFKAGTEITVGVLGNDNPRALPVIEIVPKNEFYDFESKYEPGGAQHICPARLDEVTTLRVQRLAEQVHEALGCRGVSRTDMIVDEEGQPWVLETNTIPGMTATSLLPDAAGKAGLDYTQLCVKLLELAME